MKIQHIRNATALITLGDRVILLDPMLAEAESMPGFKMVGGVRRKNPLVGLPDGATEAFETATDVVVTHEHPDHLDVPAIRWMKAKGLPVWASPIDAPNLSKKGLDVTPVETSLAGAPAQVVPAKHGRGFLGFMTGPVAGFYIAAPGEPTLYITGDTILTDEVRSTIATLNPDVILAPAGSANFGVGSDILFSQKELVELARIAPGDIVFNHMESLDHCPTTRAGLRAMLDDAGVGERAHIPNDGETVVLNDASDSPVAPTAWDPGKPGFQKWLTSFFTMT